MTGHDQIMNFVSDNDAYGWVHPGEWNLQNKERIGTELLSFRRLL